MRGGEIPKRDDIPRRFAPLGAIFLGDSLRGGEYPRNNAPLLRGGESPGGGGRISCDTGILLITSK